jgi:hypothetical protein
VSLVYARQVLHELWDEGDDGRTFCLAGPMGADARRLLGAGARLVWTVEARSHFEAMTLYHKHLGWGEYSTDYPEIDKQTYAERGWE